MAVIHNSGGNNDDVIILLSGYGQTKTEFAYFYSALARRLADRFTVVQFDYYGCGESDGNIEDVTIQILEENISSVFQYVKKTFQNSRVSIISRGISNWLTDVIDPNEVERWVFIEPVDQLSLHPLYEIIEHVRKDGNSEQYEWADIPFIEHVSWQKFFNQLGTPWYTLKGEYLKISRIMSICALGDIDIALRLNNLSKVLTINGNTSFTVANEMIETECEDEDVLLYHPATREKIIDKIANFFENA